MQTLAPIDAPGFAAPVVLPLLDRVDLGVEHTLTRSSSGALVARAPGRDEVCVWAELLDAPHTRREPARGAHVWQTVPLPVARARALTVEPPRGAAIVEASGALALYDASWTLKARHDVNAKVRDASCAIAGEVAFHLVEPDGEPPVLYAIDFVSGDVLDQIRIDEGFGEGAAWWLQHPHRHRRVVVAAGMGQDGSVCILASCEDGALRLETPDRDVIVGGRDATGERLALLQHHGDAISLREGRSTVAERDLEGHLLELDDGTAYRVEFVDERWVLLPTSEGRILLVDVASDADLIEVRLEDDARSWDWRAVILHERTLITARAEDASFGVWDAEPIFARIDRSPRRR